MTVRPQMLAEQIGSAATNTVLRKFEKVPELAPQSAAVKAVLQKMEGKGERRANMRSSLEAYKARVLPETASRAPGPGDARRYLENIADMFDAFGRHGGIEFPQTNLYRHLVNVFDGLASHPNPRVRKIAETLHPSVLERAYRILEAPLGEQREFTPAELEALVSIIAGDVAEGDLLQHPAFRTAVAAARTEMAGRKGIPPELANVKFDPRPLLVRNVRTVTVGSKSMRAYVDVMVAFAGSQIVKVKKEGKVYDVVQRPMLSKICVQSKLENVAELFPHVEDGIEVIGQLAMDEARSGLGDISLNGVRINSEDIYAPSEGAKVLVFSTAELSPSKRAEAEAQGIKVTPATHLHSTSDYRDTGRAVLKLMGAVAKRKK